MSRLSRALLLALAVLAGLVAGCSHTGSGAVQQAWHPFGLKY